MGDSEEHGATTEETAGSQTEATETEVSTPEGTEDAEESFISPKDLPDEVKPHWRRMHRAYTKFREGAGEMEKKAALVDRFNTDQDFTLQVIQEAAPEALLRHPLHQRKQSRQQKQHSPRGRN